MSVLTNRELREAMQEWDREVEAEMIRLIKSGTPPFGAGNQARATITRRRRSAALEGNPADLPSPTETGTPANQGQDHEESPPNEGEREVRERLDAYLEAHLKDFAEQDDISLPVYYRVSPEFIAAIRSQRIELARLRGEIKAASKMFGEVCEPLHECCQKYKLGLGGEHVQRLVVDEVDRLHATLPTPEEAEALLNTGNRTHCFSRAENDAIDRGLAKLRRIAGQL